ncbi:MAG: hypothetical protein SGI77_13350, partial [Pirellulaceae bacterium]|nr:hypothetical protein [Pirellulaceae bacterium]
MKRRFLVTGLLALFALGANTVQGQVDKSPSAASPVESAAQDAKKAADQTAKSASQTASDVTILFSGWLSNHWQSGFFPWPIESLAVTDRHLCFDSIV